MELFDVKDIAQYLKLSTKKIYQLIQAKQIPYKKIGGQYRFVKSEIDSWILQYSSGGKTHKKDRALLVSEPNADYSDAAGLLLKAKSITDKLKRELFIVAILTKELSKYKLKPVVVGGFAVEFYTVGGYNTGDIDLVFSDNKLLDKVLTRMDFIKEGRHWINKELDIYIEAPGSQISSGEQAHLAEVEIEGLKVCVIGVEDLIIDRLNALVHWKSTDEANWIKELILINSNKIDWSYLTTRAKEEKTFNEFSKLKKEALDAKNKLNGFS